MFSDLGTWPSDGSVWSRQVWQQQLSPSPFSLSFLLSLCPFISFLPIPTPHVSIPFIYPACTLSVCFLSTRLFVCQPVSQTGIPEQRAAEASVLFTLLHPSVHPSQGFVLFSAAINLLANRQQSRRLCIGIRFLALRPEKNAGS